MNAKNLSIILVSSLLFTGCVLNPFSGPDVKPIEVQKVQVEKTPLKLSNPKPLKLKKIEWFIVTPENIDTVFSDLKNKKYNIVLYGLTDDGYQNIALNLSGLRAYILQQQSIIKAYKNYYEPKKIEE